RRRHTSFSRDWSSDVCSSDLVGHIVRQRDYIGRPEILQIGTEATIPVQINWQVYRIRDREVILRREDPSNPDGPALTRSILMARSEERRVGNVGRRRV